jgi:uroporphyrinogen-III synthase
VNDCDLRGAGVLVTRPMIHAAPLAQAIEKIGGAPHLFPGVGIVNMDKTEVLSVLTRMAAVDMLIFVSPTAVRVAMQSTAEMGRLMDGARVAAVGQSTAAELRKYGVREIIVPSNGSGSDALVECGQLKEMAGQSVLVVRGEGGSETLATILKQRGAQVSFLECYRRVLPDSRFADIEPLLRDGRIAAWTATGGEILDNLFNIAGEHGDLLQNTPLFVNHPHVARRGFSRAVKTIFVAGGGDAGLVRGLAKWFCRLRPEMSEGLPTHN